MPSDLFEIAIAAIDRANSEDPNKEIYQGKEYPKELLYGMRMSVWLEKLRPDAPEFLRLAARAQHLRRWEVPRAQYPMDRAGYLKWRTGLYDYHAEKAGGILAGAGYDESVIQKVQALLRKQNLKTNPDMQLLEDVICLVFLENYFADFSTQHDEEKMVLIIQKTWKKMSEEGRRRALLLPMSSAATDLVKKALQHP